MKTLSFAVALLALSLPTVAQGPRTLDEGRRKGIDAVLQGAVDRGEIPSISALVVSSRGELYQGAFGKRASADTAPITPDAIFRIHSLTKPITSVAAMLLVQEKRLGLDDPIDKHLGAPTTPRVVASFSEFTGLISTSAPSTPVTVRHLLTHTSGIAYSFSNDVMYRISQSAPRIQETDVLVHEPGERWTYGPSTQVLGQVIEQVAGESLDTFLTRRIFQPLKMNDTSFAVPAEKVARVVTTHARRNGQLTETANPAGFPGTVRGDTGLFSTASDYGRFVRMLLGNGELEGTRVLEASTVKQMLTNQIGDLPIEVQPALNPALSLPFPTMFGKDGFGFGFLIARPTDANPHRRAAGTASWSGLMNANFWADPSRQVGAVLLMQLVPYNDERAAALLTAFEEAVYRALD